MNLKIFLFVLLFILVLIVLIICFIKYNYTEYFTTIPKRIMQTYVNKDKVPQKVFDNIKKFAPDYEYHFFNHKERFEFIKQNYDKSIVDTYLHITNKAHQSDLFRYCYLYKYGGIYLDIKIELIKPLSDIFKDNYLYTALSIVKNTVCQGIIATPPKNKLFLDLITFVKNQKEPFQYHIFTRDFYSKIQIDTGNPLKNGVNYGKKMNYYLLNEKCTHNKKDCYDGLDNKGLCCFIYDDNKPVIKVRYADYPW